MAPSNKTSIELAIEADVSPIAIGGLGGSGTRLIAQMFETLEFYLGSDLNGSLDNLSFTLLFKRKDILSESPATISQSFDLLINSLRGKQPLTAADLKLIGKLTLSARPMYPKSWLVDRANRLSSAPACKHHKLIAWKEPNTHILLDQLLECPAGIKYLHVMRDGLDMAFSENQQQLLLWGEYSLERPVKKCPADALDYWNAIHSRVFAIKARFPDRVEVVSYDKICRRDQNEIIKVYSFAGINPTSAQLSRIEGLIAPPKSIGRGKKLDMEHFDCKALQEYRTLMQL